MKIVAINGSPRGQDSNTNVMVTAFLKGAREAGAETVNIFLAEKEIKHCKCCMSCWINSPGKCVIEDDMAEVLSLEEGADILVLATPLYFDNISGMLKVYMDRRVALAAPPIQKDSNGECRHVNPANSNSPFSSGATPSKLVMISNCGYPERSQFQAVSLWVSRAARNLITEVTGEIYATLGIFLQTRAEFQPFIAPFLASYPELAANAADYLQLIEKAGKEIATDNRLSEETNKQLQEQKFIPDDIYIQVHNSLVSSKP